MTNRVKEIIKEMAGNAKSFCFGRESYNLDIKASKDLEASCSQHESKYIGPYIGSFIVTDLGYLTNGFNESLRTRTAEIKNKDFLETRLIHFEDGEIDTIIYDLLGPRLLPIEYKREVPTCLSKMAFA